VTISEEKPTGLIGQPLPRKENFELLTGAAVFVNDIALDRMLHARVLRSPKAHARIISTDASRARTMPGVCDVVTGADLVGRVNRFGGLQKGLPYNDRIVLAHDKVVFDGQEVAAVAAETWYQAQDAIEAIEVIYEDLPPIVDPEQAVRPDAARIWDFTDSNVWDTYTCRIGEPDTVDAPVVVGGKFTTNRPSAVALEPHGCVADFDRQRGKLTLYTSTQFTHLLAAMISDVLKIPHRQVRVVAPHVGGSFGSKGDAFPHEMIACLLAVRTGRPVKLILDRSEVFRAVGTRCSHVSDSEMTVSEDGQIVGYRTKVLHNTGAVSPWGGQIMRIGLHIGMLPYPIPHLLIDACSVATTTPTGGPLRGFGIPQVVFVKEQLIDMAAEELGIDPVEMRLRNIPSDAKSGYVTPSGIKIDNTTIRECLSKAASEIGWWTRTRDREENTGYGVALAAKYTSARHPSIDSDLSTVRIGIGADGRVTVRSGDVPHGQGHATMLSQIVADHLGANYDDIDVVSADTDATPFSLGTFGSRSAAVLGTAAAQASGVLRNRVCTIAAHLLGTSPDNLVVENGIVHVAGNSEAALPFAAIAGTALFMTNSLPAGISAGPLEVQSSYDTPTERERADGGGNWAATYSAAAHAARVRVDPDTGEYWILDYVMAHDSGNVINPLIVEGQHHGGFVHGYGMVVGENLEIDSDGQVLNASLATYPVPTAHDVPNLHRNFEINKPSTTIPIGAKGAGETSTGPVPAVIANALADATGVRFRRLPITAEDVALAIAEKNRRGVDRMVWPVSQEGER
jgi:carbon-monoxide dehydrogenase large subunit